MWRKILQILFFLFLLSPKLGETFSTFERFRWLRNLTTSIFGIRSRYLENSGAETLAQELHQTVPDHCLAVHVNILARHGTIHPGWGGFVSGAGAVMCIQIIFVLFSPKELEFAG